MKKMHAMIIRLSPEDRAALDVYGAKYGIKTAVGAIRHMIQRSKPKPPDPRNPRPVTINSLPPGELAKQVKAMIAQRLAEKAETSE